MPPACFVTGTGGDRIRATITRELLRETDGKVPL
jgi:hypothetical protein